MGREPRGVQMRLSRPPQRYDYIDDGAAIYVDSFATIPAQSRFDHLTADAEKVAVRMVHGTGQQDSAGDLLIPPRRLAASRAALQSRALILPAPPTPAPPVNPPTP